MDSYLAHVSEIYYKAHENPRAFSCISGPIYLESSIQCPCEVRLHHVSPASTNNRRIEVAGEKRKEGDAHVVTLEPTWPKPQQASHSTHQYAQHHPSFLACAENSSGSAPVQPRTFAPLQRAPAQTSALTQPRSPNDTNPGMNFNMGRNPPMKKLPEFAPIPMTYGDLLPSLIANQLAVVTPGRIYQSPFPKWYNPNTTCTYHGGTPGHSVEQCMALKHKVQSLIEAGWLTFQEDGPNVKTNPLTNQGGSAVNAIEVCSLRSPKHLKDVTTSTRFIFEALQEAGVVPLGGHKGDPCLMHPGAPHDMETWSAMEELLQ